MADDREVAFAKSFAAGLAQHPVTYDDDFQPPVESFLKRVPVLPVCRPLSVRVGLALFHLGQIPVPEPPERKQDTSSPVGLHYRPHMLHTPLADRLAHLQP